MLRSLAYGNTIAVRIMINSRSHPKIEMGTVAIINGANRIQRKIYFDSINFLLWVHILALDKNITQGVFLT